MKRSLRWQLASVRSADRPLRIVLIGAPGSGKGTHAANLEKQYGFQPIVAGNLLRTEIKKESAFGREAAAVMKAGGLMPDTVMVTLLQTVLSTAKPSQDFVFDGYPRNIAQAERLDNILSERDESLDLVLQLDVPDRVILERIIGRWIHDASGRVYNDSFNPPKRAGFDDLTGDPLIKRIDDDPIIYGKRLKEFHAKNAPILEHYRSTGLLAKVSGPTSKIIWPQIVEILRERFGRVAS